jgi:hypothetical protein
MDFNKVCVPGKRKVSYGVYIEFSKHMKLVMPIKMCLNSEWLETWRVSVVMLLNFALECADMKIQKIPGLIRNE